MGRSGLRPRLSSDRSPSADALLMARLTLLRRTARCVALLALLGRSSCSRRLAGRSAATPAAGGVSFLQKLNAERVQRRPRPARVGHRAGRPRPAAGRSDMASRNAALPRPQPRAPSPARSSRTGGRSARTSAWATRVQSLHDAFMAARRPPRQHPEAELQPRRHRRRPLRRQDLGDRPLPPGPRHLRHHRPRTAPPPPGVRTALTGDFDGDGYDDLLTYNPGTTGRRAVVRARRPAACTRCRCR